MKNADQTKARFKRDQKESKKEIKQKKLQLVRKKRNETFGKSEDRLNIIFENANDEIIYTDINGIIIEYDVL